MPRQEIALALPVRGHRHSPFRLPAMFFNSTSHFSVVDTRASGIIHLWAEGFFEVLATAMVALIFYQLGIVSTPDSCPCCLSGCHSLPLAAGIVGTGHHRYWTATSSIAPWPWRRPSPQWRWCRSPFLPWMKLGLRSSSPRVPVAICGKPIAVPHRWTFDFLILPSWLLEPVGAGVFGFLPSTCTIVSYFEVGTMLTPNARPRRDDGGFQDARGWPSRSARMRRVSPDERWARSPEKFIRVSFWGLNCGLGHNGDSQPLPGGVLRFLDPSLNNGYRHCARAGVSARGKSHT